MAILVCLDSSNVLSVYFRNLLVHTTSNSERPKRKGRWHVYKVESKINKKNNTWDFEYSFGGYFFEFDLFEK